MFRAIAILWLLALPAWGGECTSLVSQAPYLTRSLEWLGLGDCLVGVNRYDSLDLPRTGGVMDPDADALAALAPAVWFASDWASAETLKAATPEGTRTFRLGGFKSMGEVEGNLRLMARLTGRGAERAAAFPALWREKAHAIDGGGRRALLLSACSGTPYLFGADSWLQDLFAEAGFTLVADHPRIRHVPLESDPEALNKVVRELDPEIIFAFKHGDSRQCAVLPPTSRARIVMLDGQQLLHPAPVLLEGLDQLIALRPQWQ